MSARISQMYKRSGGCNTEHKCGECISFIQSPVRSREFMCNKHGDADSHWHSSWMACRYWGTEEPKPKKRKPRAKKQKASKYKEETTGQLQMVF